MNKILSILEVDTLIESLSYSKDKIRNHPDTPHEVRSENLRRMEAVDEKLRAWKREVKSTGTFKVEIGV